MTVELQRDRTTQLGRNGQLAAPLPRPAGEAPGTSSWLEYLPAPYQADAFTGRFLQIPEHIFTPIERMVDSLAAYFDPRLAPAELLPWLAAWVGVELDENWPLERRRLLVLWAARLYRWRGTRRGLREHLRLYVGRAPLIVENFDGARVGQDAQLGVNTRVGSPLPRPHTVHITILADDPAQVDERIVRHIIELEKPAHVGYTFEVRPAGDRQRGVGGG